MDSLKYKVAYLNGLMEGLDIDRQSKEGRIFSEIINVLDFMVEEIEELKSSHKDLEDYIESIDEDLTAVKDEVYDYDSEELEGFEPVEMDEESYIDITCPSCQEKVYVEREVFASRDEIKCPNCHNDLIMDYTKKELNND